MRVVSPSQQGEPSSIKMATSTCTGSMTKVLSVRAAGWNGRRSSEHKQSLGCHHRPSVRLVINQAGDRDYTRPRNHKILDDSEHSHVLQTLALRRRATSRESFRTSDTRNPSQAPAELVIKAAIQALARSTNPVQQYHYLSRPSCRDMTYPCRCRFLVSLWNANAGVLPHEEHVEATLQRPSGCAHETALGLWRHGTTVYLDFVERQPQDLGPAVKSDVGMLCYKWYLSIERS